MDHYEDELDDITQEDCWQVIGAFFKEKGLVRQQLDSFDEFIHNTMQEIVDENSTLQLQTLAQFTGQDNDISKQYIIKFGQTFLSKPAMTEADGSIEYLHPHNARLRNLTYCAPLYVDMQWEVHQADMAHPQNQAATSNADIHWDLIDQSAEPEKVFIGRVPIMLRSKYCMLENADQDQLTSFKECPYDSGGYFVINGSEKVLIAQERMASNQVYVFAKAPPAPYTFSAEIRSQAEKGSNVASTLFIKMMHSRSGHRAFGGQIIHTSLPYIKADIPIIIVFRALGIVADRDILEHICYDFNDRDMLELLKPCIEEAFVIQDREVALDFIGKRGAPNGVSLDKRIKYAEDILQKEMLPHVGVKSHHQTRKAYFFGYMIHRLLLAALERRQLDDRDHFGKKRLDLAGPLMAGLFRLLFRKLTRDIGRYLQKCVDDNKEFNVNLAVKSSTITNGLRYSLATGNWGDQKKFMSARAGVSQVLNRYTYASTLSHLRRLNTPIGRDGKLAKPRQLHNTHWGYVCPAETPEGQAVGLVKNLSLMAVVTVGSNSIPIREFLDEWTMLNLEEVSPFDIAENTKVFVNGSWAGIQREPDKLVQTLRKLRRCGDLNPEVSVVRDVREGELRLYTDAGRICRPLFIVDEENQMLTLTKAHVDEITD
ncbi:beta and beta-prime subunits of DNA dependent RNA-polymerase, partial [Caulochytrium protostelioides]